MSSAPILILATLLVNFINLVFNAYLGRVLTFDQYGLIAIVSTFLYVAQVPFNALYNTVNHSTASVVVQKDRQSGLDFLQYVNKKTIKVAILISLLWIISSPFITNFFHIGSFLVPIFFTPVILLGVITAANKGFLLGSLSFISVAVVILFEALSKLVFAWLLVLRNFNYWVYLAIPLSTLVAFLISVCVINRGRMANHQLKHSFTFPKKFYTAAIVTGLSSIAYVSMDLILAKHFLLPKDAGKYALLSLLGNMIYFLGILPNTFILTLVSRDEGNYKSPKRTFYKLLIFSVLLTFGALMGIIFLGNILIPLVFGSKAETILPYLPIYTIAISLFTFSSTIISYHLARRHFLFPLLGITMGVIMSVGILFYHSTIYQITHIVFYTSILSIFTLAVFHLLETVGILKLRKGWIKVSYEG